MKLFGNIGVSTSGAGELNATDWAKTIRTMVFTAIGAGVAATLASILSMLQSGTLDLGNYAWLLPVIITLVTGLSDLVNRYFKNNLS